MGDPGHFGKKFKKDACSKNVLKVIEIALQLAAYLIRMLGKFFVTFSKCVVGTLGDPGHFVKNSKDMLVAKMY